MIDKFGTSSQIFSVEGKKALITGGSKGLGRAMALCLLENGCDVFLTSRHVDTARKWRTMRRRWAASATITPVM